MAKRGPKPKPTRLKVIEGNPGHRPLNENEPAAPVGDLPDPPSFLHPLAVEHWHFVAPDLYGMGVLSRIDVAVFAAYCQCFARWRIAEEAIAKDAKKRGNKATSGLTVKTKNGNVIQNPMLSTANAAFRDMAKLAAELGLTPSARTTLENKRGQSEDPLVAKYGLGA